MTIKHNKEAVLRMTEAFNNTNPSVVPHLLAREYQEDWTFALDRDSDEPLERMPPVHRIQREMALVRAAFPDAHYAVRELVAERNTVILIWDFTGTHSGEFFGRPPTGRALKVTGFEVVKFNRQGQMIGHIDNHPQTAMDTLAQVGFLDAETLAQMGMPQIPREG